MEKKNSLTKDEKLKSRKEIEALFKQRQSFFIAPVRVFFSVKNEEGTVKAGFGCSKKYFKHAVRRNRAKRLMREAYRTQKHSLIETLRESGKSLDIFFLFSNNELISYAEMQTTIFATLQRMEKLIRNKE